MKQPNLKNNHREAGFTLVELSIVLVIIGLIAGGVLVGQDMIRAAAIRATITQIEKYDSAVNTFRDKYGSYPGDMIQSRAVQYGITPTTRAGTDGLGDGDGTIENGATATDKQGVGNETTAFWSDLSQARLMPERITVQTAYAVTAYANFAALEGAFVLPPSKLRNIATIHVYNYNGRNYYYLGNISAVAATGVVTLAPGVTVNEAENIDRKLDDGDGDQGVVMAVSNITANAEDDGSLGTAAFGEAQDCFSANTGVYNSTDANGAGLNCRMSIRASF